MRKLLFKDSLKLELNVIGYHDQGESIVFFIKTDGYVVYTGLVDCYKTEEQNAVKAVLEKEQVERIDFVCWTHPHDDHTVGLDEVWAQIFFQKIRSFIRKKRCLFLRILKILIYLKREKR